MIKLSEFGVSIGRSLVSFAFLFLFFTTEVWTQMPQVVISDKQETPPPAEDRTWWYIMLFLLCVGLAGAIYWFKVNKKQQSEKLKEAGKKPSESDALDLDKEMEWFRKNRNIINKQKSSLGKPGRTLPKANIVKKSKTLASKNTNSGKGSNEQNLPSDLLPIFAINRLEFARPFDQLPLSSDQALMSAIEQTQDEFEEDESFRELSVKVLAAFKTQNSVEALSQVALYDLSSFLRSKAVTVLADFNHESVFETILLACADPTREVRAAAARGLFQLNLDRADAWSRISETNDKFRIKQAARAAIEGELSDRYFERLVHPDNHNAYEAFAFVALLLKSDETESVFNVMQNHRDLNIRKAILHVIKVTKEPNALEGLYSIIENEKLSPEMREEADRLVEEIGLAVI